MLTQVEKLAPDAAEPEQRLQVVALVDHPADGGWVLRLEIVSGASREQRELLGDSCQALVDSVAVMLALQLNAPPARTVESPPPAAEPVAPPPAPPEPVAPPKPARAGAPSERGKVQLGVSAALDSVALPELALGGRFELGWVPGRVILGLSASTWPTQEQSLSSAGSGSASFGFRAAALVVCHATWGSAVRLGPCLSAEVGELSAQSFGVRVPDGVSELWLAGLAGVGLWLPFSESLLLSGGLSLVVPLRRPEFVIEGVGQIHQPAPLGGRGSLGLTARF